MNIREFEITRYKNDIQSNLGFNITFPNILKIQQEIPVSFQERVRHEGYPEFRIERAEGAGNILFEFFSNQHNYRIAFGKDSLVLVYDGTSIHYEDIRTRIGYMVSTFNDFYSPSYFSGLHLMHRYSIGASFLHRCNIDLSECVPTYIFPELSTGFDENLYSLEKNVRFNYNEMEVNVNYILGGPHNQSRTNNEELYVVTVDCFHQQNIGDINEILTNFDKIKKSGWNILHSGITDELRASMGTVK